MRTSLPSNALAQTKAFALVITLIMVVLAAIMAVALLSNASLDRTTARSTDDQYQAELAVQNALEAAKRALTASPSATTSVTADDTFLVTRIDAPAVPLSPASPVATAAYYYLAKAQPGAANKIDYYPLFAGGAPTTGTINLAAGATPPVVSGPTPPPNPNASSPGTAAIDTDLGKTKILRAYPQVSPWLGPPSTQWIEIRDPNDSATPPAHNLPYQRYTYWIEDLAGYIDASVAGNTNGTNTSNRRPDSAFTPTAWSTYATRYKTTPAELALFTLFDSTSTADPGTTRAKDLIGNRPLLFTVGTLKQIAPGPANTDITSSVLASRLIADKEVPLVPFGYDYQDEGKASKPKVDINAQVIAGGAGAVQAIATKINDNLQINNVPVFGAQRKGGLTGLDYVNTIAASIIDYADTDSNATVGADYRGYDSYPLVNELFTMRWWTGSPLRNGTYHATISMDTWVELWNPSNQPITGTASIDILENVPVQVGNYTYTFGTKPADLPNGSTVSTAYPPGSATLNVTMQPNEYTTYHLRTDTFQFNSGFAPPLVFPPTPLPGASPHKLPLSASLASSYEMSWSAGGPPVVVDKAGGGIQRLSGSLSGPPNYIASNKNWRGSTPGFGYTDSLSTAIPKFNTLGDPRSAFYAGSAQISIVYDVGSSFWVRNNRSNIATTAIYKEVKPSAWPDRGHEQAPTVVTAPGSGSVADPPTTRPSNATTDSTKAPATISNAGSYSTTAEFGNICDPGQWNITPDSSNHWNDITNGTPADNNYGGGMTLRIGRPEFTRFDQPKVRAWQLLDLFYPGNRVDTRGLVNINTASRDVLRVLGANVLLNRDPDLKDVNGNSINALYPPYTSSQADLFADAVIAARPFLSPAQLSSVTAGGAQFFGNSAAWTSAPQPSEWNDSGTEEYFAKVFPLTTVRSRNFRVFATGQALSKDGKVLSNISKGYQVYLNPARNATTGTITSQNVLTTYEIQLP